MGAGGSNASHNQTAELVRSVTRSGFAQPPHNGPHNAYGKVNVKYKPWSVPVNNITSRLQLGLKKDEFRYSPPTDFDPAEGCEKTLTASYVCGSAAPINIPSTPFGKNSTDEVHFNCKARVDECNDYRFEVTTQGSVLFTNRGGALIKSRFTNTGSNASVNTNEYQNSDQPRTDIEKINQMVLNNALPSSMNFKRKYVRYMNPGDSLGPGEYICSSTGNCFFGLDPVDSRFKIFTIKIRSDQKSSTVNNAEISVMEGFADLGTNISGALYELNGVDTKNLNAVANISIDGKKRLFGTSTLKLGDKYTEVITIEPSSEKKITYDNPGNDLETIANESGDINYCFDRCSSRPDCGGFVIDSTAPDKCFLKDKDIFPSANRVRDVDKHLYKRLYTPKNHRLPIERKAEA